MVSLPLILTDYEVPRYLVAKSVQSYFVHRPFGSTSHSVVSLNVPL